MRRRKEVRHQERQTSAHNASALLSVLLVACGSHVVVAERTDAGAHITHADADLGGDDADKSIFICGRSRCTNHPTSIAGVTLNGYACCYDPEHSVCGVIELDNCIPLDQPGHLEASCATVTSPQLGVLPGCCKPGGTCGSFETNVGIGCIQIPFLTPVASCAY